MKPGDVMEVMDQDGRTYHVKAISIIPGSHHFRGEWIEGPHDGDSVVVDYSS